MLDHNDSPPGSKVVRWTDDEWVRIASALFSQQSGKQANPSGLEEVKAKDVFLAQNVLPSDRHRKLVSIAQGFDGVRVRLYAILQMPCETNPEVALQTGCIKSDNVEPGRALRSKALDWAKDRAGVLHVPINANKEADMTFPYTQPEYEKTGTSEAKSALQNRSARQISKIGEVRMEQSFNFNAGRVEQTEPLQQERPSASNSAEPVPEATNVIDLIRPFISMICEEFAWTLVRVIAAQGSGNDLPARTPAGFKQRGADEHIKSNTFRELKLHRDSTPDASTKSRGSIAVDRPHPASLLEPLDDSHPDTDEIEVQPLFDPKLPPAANSEFKPNIGIVATNANDVLELRHLYPQLNLTIIQADTITDVRKFGHCQRIIVLHDEISPTTDELLGHLLRHRYVRLRGGMAGIKDQLNAWLEAPGSMISTQRRTVSRYNKKPNDEKAGKKQNRYPRMIGQW